MTKSALSTLAALFLLAVPSVSSGAASSTELWEAWPSERFVETPAPCLRPGELDEAIAELAERHPRAIAVEEIGRSVQDRPIHLLTLGTGERKVLLWSQMHGDEPSATPALLDIADYLVRHRDEPGPRAILSELTLLVVPMLNPDGSEVYTRQNAMAIDVNRDALNLATPEGRLLKAIRDEHEPILGFNLHDQNRRRTVGDTGILATNAVLAVAGDEQNTVTPGRQRAKRAASAITTALSPIFPGGMARYDETFSPRAFGDNVTAWGTPVVLIESGGLPEGRPFTDLTRTNFVGILAALEAMALNDLEDHDPRIYETLGDNEVDEWANVVVRDGEIVQPGSPAPYRADLAFDVLVSDRRWAGCPEANDPVRSRIVEVGDARFLASGDDVWAEGLWVAPSFDAVVEGWKARRWLGGDALDTWARRGVRSVRWVVPPRRLEAAREIVGELSSGSRLRVEAVTSAPARLLRLSGPPESEPGDSLAETLGSLSGRASWTGDAIRGLWPTGDTPSPILRRGRDASFLLLEPAADGSLAGARVEAVWLDGIQVGEEAR